MNFKERVRELFHERGLNYSQILGEENTVISIGLEGFNDSLQAITELVIELIGEDDRDYSQDNAGEQELMVLVACATACNELRAELKSKVTEDKEA